MSKIGRLPIALGDVKVEIKGQEIHFTGKNNSGVHVVPAGLVIKVDNGELLLTAAEGIKKGSINRAWGLNRALVANKIYGAQQMFEKQVKITGLGYKAVSNGKQIEFNLGYSHKVFMDLPEDVTMETDKTGQLLTLKSYNKELIGKVSGEMRALRPTEPYKGTGVKLTTDIIIKKAGKAKGA